MRNPWLLAVMVAAALPAHAADVGQVKVAHGAVTLERAGSRLPVAVGMAVQPSDVIVTGADGSAGLTFSDNSLVSIGPESRFAIDKYAFDTNTYAGEVHGTLSNDAEDPLPARNPLFLDNAAEVHTGFRDLRPARSYGVGWQPAS